MNIGVLHHNRPTLERVRQRLATCDADVWLATTSAKADLGRLRRTEHLVPIAEDQYYPLLFLKHLLAGLVPTRMPLLLVEADILLKQADVKTVSDFKNNCYFLYKELEPRNEGAYGRKRTMSMFLTEDTVDVLSSTLQGLDDAMLRIPLYCEPSFIVALLGIAPCTSLRLTHISHANRALPTRGLLARSDRNAVEPPQRHIQRALMRALAAHVSPRLCRELLNRILARLRPHSKGVAIFGLGTMSMFLADLISTEPLIRCGIDHHYPLLSKVFATKPAILPETVAREAYNVDTVIAVGRAEHETDLIAECLSVLPPHLRVIPLRYDNWSTNREDLLVDVLVRQALNGHGYFARLFSVLLEKTGGLEQFRMRFAALLDPTNAATYDKIGLDALRHWQHI